MTKTAFWTIAFGLIIMLLLDYRNRDLFYKSGFTDGYQSRINYEHGH